MVINHLESFNLTAYIDLASDFKNESTSLDDIMIQSTKLRHRITGLIFTSFVSYYGTSEKERNMILNLAKLCDRLQILEVNMTSFVLEDGEFQEMISEISKQCKELNHLALKTHTNEFTQRIIYLKSDKMKNEIKNFFETCISIQFITLITYDDEILVIFNRSEILTHT